MQKKELYIVKIGSEVIDDPEKQNRFLMDFAKIPGKKILVHGGGKTATEIAGQLKIPQQMLDGRRVTNHETLKVIMMVYAGLINKTIVARLAANGLTPLGLSGADGNLILAKKRTEVPVDFGFVGDIISVNTENILKLIHNGFTPVFCALTHDNKGQVLNTNADTMAAALAKALSEAYECSLIYGFEKEGVLADVTNENSVVPELNTKTYQLLKAEGKIFKGMIPKLENAFDALKNGVASVYILKAEAITSLIMKKEHHGTRIKN